MICFSFFHFQWINVSFAHFWVRLNCFKKPLVLKCGQNWVCLMGLRDNGSREECVCMWETRLPSPRMHFLLQGRTFKNSTDLFQVLFSLRTCPVIFQVQCVGVLPVSGSAVNFLCSSNPNVSLWSCPVLTIIWNHSTEMLCHSFICASSYTHWSKDFILF